MRTTCRVRPAALFALVAVVGCATRSTDVPKSAGRGAPDDPLRAGLVACWPFDDGTGRDSVGTNDAVLVGGAACIASPMGRALNVSSPATYARADGEGVCARGWRGITVSVWLKPRRYNTYSWTITRGTEADVCGYYIGLSPVTQGHFDVTYGNARTNWMSVKFDSFRTRADPPANQWHHIVGTYDGQRMRCYLNGVLDGESPAPVPGAPIYDTPDASTYIGTISSLPFRNWGDIFTDGAYDEVRIYNRGLSASEVGLLYRAGTQYLGVAASPVQPPVPAAGHATTIRQPATAEPSRPRESLPKPVSYFYNDVSSRGVLTVDIGSGGMEARDWVLKNIGKIASSKEMLLEAGSEPTTGGRYKVLNETLKDHLLTVEFEVVH
jgi:hypothetical protein